MSERVVYLGCTWVKAGAVLPGDASAPKNIPLCPFCLAAGVEQEARPKYEWSDTLNRMAMDVDPVTLLCRHPCHADSPFEAVMDHASWEYAALRLDLPGS